MMKCHCFVFSQPGENPHASKFGHHGDVGMHKIGEAQREVGLDFFLNKGKKQLLAITGSSGCTKMVKRKGRWV